MKHLLTSSAVADPYEWYAYLFEGPPPSSLLMNYYLVGVLEFCK